LKAQGVFKKTRAYTVDDIVAGLQVSFLTFVDVDDAIGLSDLLGDVDCSDSSSIRLPDF
jgi:hypothetical protein